MSWWVKKSAFCLTWYSCRPYASCFSRKGYLGESVGLAPRKPFETSEEPPSLPQPATVSVPHDFGVMGPAHSNILNDGCWMHSNDCQAGGVGVQACQGPSSHHRREKPIPDKHRADYKPCDEVLLPVQDIHNSWETLSQSQWVTVSENKGLWFLPLYVYAPCSPPLPLSHRPHPRGKIWFDICVPIVGGRQLEKCNLPALIELELPIQTSLHSSCSQMLLLFLSR